MSDEQDDVATLRARLVEAHEELVRRDDTYRFAEEVVGALRRDNVLLNERLEQVARELADRQARLDALDETVKSMRATRVWALAERWWRLRSRLSRARG